MHGDRTLMRYAVSIAAIRIVSAIDTIVETDLVFIDAETNEEAYQMADRYVTRVYPDELNYVGQVWSITGEDQWKLRTLYGTRPPDTPSTWDVEL
jgi:hypothetical protein